MGRLKNITGRLSGIGLAGVEPTRQQREQENSQQRELSRRNSAPINSRRDFERHRQQNQERQELLRQQREQGNSQSTRPPVPRTPNEPTRGIPGKNTPINSPNLPQPPRQPVQPTQPQQPTQPEQLMPDKVRERLPYQPRPDSTRPVPRTPVRGQPQQPDLSTRPVSGTSDLQSTYRNRQPIQQQKPEFSDMKQQRIEQLELARAEAEMRQFTEDQMQPEQLMPDKVRERLPYQPAPDQMPINGRPVQPTQPQQPVMGGSENTKPYKFNPGLLKSRIIPEQSLQPAVEPMPEQTIEEFENPEMISRFNLLKNKLPQNS